MRIAWILDGWEFDRIRDDYALCRPAILAIWHLPGLGRPCAVVSAAAFAAGHGMMDRNEVAEDAGTAKRECR